MKLNLLLNSKNVRSGFVNVDPLASPDEADKVRADVCNLDAVAEDAEVDELVATDVIDYLPARQLDDIVDNWIRKIRHGGTIVVGGVDVREVARGVVNQELDLESANRLLYGFQDAPWEYRKAALTVQKLIDVFASRGFKILHKRLENYYYQVKAERP